MQTSFPAARKLGPTSPSHEVLDAHHLHVFTRAVSQVLSTEIAKFTLAQLIDGLPVKNVTEQSVRWLDRDHPIAAHETLCDKVFEKTEIWLSEFSPSDLRVESWRLQAFQSANAGTRLFNLRLLELTAVAIHQVAVSLFNMSEKLHQGDITTVTSWRPPLKTRTWENARGRIKVEEIPRPPVYPTLFTNIYYLDYEQYPYGIADIAGYWAEDWIFGGVVLFDRGDSDDDCKDVYLHSGRSGVTKRVWRPNETQEALVFDFLTSDVAVTCPFPLSCDRSHTVRHDAWDAMALHHIYRDPWERKETPQKDYEREYARHSSLDYPEMEPGTSSVAC